MESVWIFSVHAQQPLGWGPAVRQPRVDVYVAANCRSSLPVTSLFHLQTHVAIGGHEWAWFHPHVAAGPWNPSLMKALFTKCNFNSVLHAIIILIKTGCK